MNVQLLTILLGKWLPVKIKEGIYWACFKVIRKSFKKFGEVYPRNSLVTGQISFGTSDIDLNLWIDKKMDWNNFSQTEKKLKKWIPITGEVNVLSLASVRSMLRFINPYLMDKDPLLIQKFNYNLCVGGLAEKMCYLLHCYEANRGKINLYPCQSEKKWTYYYSQVNLPRPRVISEDELIRSIGSLIPQLDLGYLKKCNFSDDVELNKFYHTVNINLK